MSGLSSALYFGGVVHRRLKPQRHRLRYSVYMMLLDLDEIPEVTRDSSIFSHNRFNLFAFHDRDYGNGDGSSLRAYVEAQLSQAGIVLDGGPIRLLTSARVLGYVFNPLSVYFCYRRTGELAAILYEVSNTFGQRHSYLIPADPQNGGAIHQACDKLFHVSPFIGMDMRYKFRIQPPDGSISVAIQVEDREGPLLHAAFGGKREDLSDSNLAWAFLRFPLLTLKIVFGIHWHALKLFLKGAKFHKLPPAPPNPVTIVRSDAG